MTTAHTPTPWKLDYDPRWMWANIARQDGAMPRIAKGLDQADAAYIVRCVNAHDALVAALEQVVACVDPIPSDKLARAAIANARAALAAAKGEA